MNGERRRRIEDIFDEALERPASERDDYLASACEGDAALRGEVERLLRAHERVGGVLDSGLPAGDTLLPAADMIDRRVGPYRILRELGRGGMGIVYLAERDDGQFRRQVALKILRDPDPRLHARIIAERQILASLQHPAIAALLDGGVTTDGRPYLVMEHVSGLPIDAYCDRMRLTIRDRLKLFLGVLRAVDHAHRNLIVHRDLKPSNILVTTTGQLKLLDFGIAKLLNPALAPAEAAVTHTEQRALTPEYASPEQVRGETLTTASDVYSLGVVLYEMLCGRRPYRLTGLTMPEMLAQVCDRDPAAPSRRVVKGAAPDGRDTGQNEPAAEAVAEARATTIERLQRALRGDLDAIVAMALRKEPERRYRSVELLAQDVEAFLDGRPVIAQHGTRLYHAGKLLRRHSAAAIAAALVTLSLLTGATLAAWQAGVANVERDRAEAALLQAREALNQSDEITTFLLGLFEAGDPEMALGAQVTAQDLLRRGVTRADQLADQPLVQASMLGVMGRIYHNMGRYEDAQRLTERALDNRIRSLGEDHAAVAAMLVQLGTVLRFRSAYDSAASVLVRAAEIQRRVLGDSDTAVANTLFHLAGIRIYQARLDEAERIFRDVAARQRAVLTAEHEATLNTLNSLASLLRLKGSFDEAESTFREAHAIRERAGTANTLTGARDLLQVADLIMAEDTTRLDEAETLLRRALDITRDVSGEHHPDLTWPLNSLASLHMTRGDFTEAEQRLREVIDIRSRAYGADHPSIAQTESYIAEVLAAAGRFDEAERGFRSALEKQRAQLGRRNSLVAGTLLDLGEMLVRQGRAGEAIPYLEEGVRLRREIFGPDNFTVATALTSLASAHVALEKFDTAQAELQRALEISRRYFPDHHRDVRTIHSTLADLSEAQGRAEDARRYRALAARR